MLDKWYLEPTATQLEQRRERLRVYKSLTYDCFNAITDGIGVTCKCGHPLKGQHAATLLREVLKGVTSPICRNCTDRDTEEE
jgi:hypothetical protein